MHPPSVSLGHVAFATLFLLTCVSLAVFWIWCARGKHGWRPAVTVGVLVGGMLFVGYRTFLGAQDVVTNRVHSVLASTARFALEIVHGSDWTGGETQGLEARLTQVCARDGVVSGVFLARRRASGDWAYVVKPGADFDRDGSINTDLERTAPQGSPVPPGLTMLDEAWRGKAVSESGGFGTRGDAWYAWLEPVKDEEGTVVAVLVVMSPASSWVRDVEPTQWSAVGTTALACLILIAGGAMLAQLLQSLSSLRVSKAEAALQQEQIRSHMEVIAQRNQDMAEHQSRLAEAYSKLRALATTDGLTGLLNHRALMDFLSAAIRNNSNFGSPCSAVLMDVDNFKQLNDQFGHPAGDEALRVLAAVLAHSAPPGSAVGRYGGEEFMLVLPGASENAATAVAEELRRRIQMAKTSSRPITVSVGVSTVYSMSKSEQALLDEADRALYSSKRNGKNRVTHFGQGLLETAV